MFEMNVPDLLRMLRGKSVCCELMVTATATTTKKCRLSVFMMLFPFIIINHHNQHFFLLSSFLTYKVLEKKGMWFFPSWPEMDCTALSTQE